MKHIFLVIFFFCLVRSPEPPSGGVAMPPTGRGAYVVCVDEAEVRGGPADFYYVQYTLPFGTEINVRERAKWTLEGWAMIKPALWVSDDDICKK
jgi:hypothetical protein